MTRDRLELVEELFEEALRMQADRRSQSLRRACGSDTDLLEEVESLLAAHAEAESFIETSAYNVFADVLTFAESESLEGKQVGHYYVLSMLGRGGMGEVYLAEDNLLARKVALKVLPPSPAAASIRLERFVREARAASALNHPNIVTIYEIGRFEDSHFIAQELVEGQTLRERITGKLIDVEPAIDIGIQVGRALSASHAAGVVHRDIKPENIMIRPDGVVKVLDFGLAKFTEVASAKMSGSGGVFGSDPANETVPGTVMGTVTYMSPEQARGSAIDQRSDMFSLGVVLYEMLCGRPPFKGETPSDTIAEILKSEPKPAGELRNGLPVGIEEILDRSLKKDVAARYQTIDEMLAALRSIDPKRVSSKSFLGRRYLAARRAARTVMSPGALLMVIALLLVATVLIWSLKKRGGHTEVKAPTVTHRTALLNWKMEPGESFQTGRFSPDGKFIAYCQTRNGKGFISIKPVSGGDPVQIVDGLSNQASPVWSPDGQNLSYVSRLNDGFAICQVPASGGAPQALAQVPADATVRLVRWSKESNRIYYERAHNLFALEIDSKRSTQITDFDPAGSTGDFSVSPDEKWAAFVEGVDGQFDLWVKCLLGNCSRKITNEPETAADPEWLPDSQGVVYSSAREGILQLFLAFTDSRSPQQLTFGENNQSVCDVSPDGQRILCASSTDECDIWRVDTRDGAEFDVTSDAGVEVWPGVSPDDKNLLFQSVGRAAGKDYVHSSILTMSLSLSGRTAQIISNGFDPMWTTNGQRIAFLRTAEGITDIWSADPDGSNQVQLTKAGIMPDALSDLPYSRGRSYSWSPDSHKVAYCSLRVGARNIYVLDVDNFAEGKITSFTDAQAWPRETVWSKAGDVLAYVCSGWQASGGHTSWTLYASEKGVSRKLFTSDPELFALGWVAHDILIAQVIAGTRSRPLNDVRLLEIAGDGQSRPIKAISEAYIHDMALSPDAATVGLVERSDGADNVWVLQLKGGMHKKITNNKDPRLYLSGVSWSPDGRSIYFGKQADTAIISMVDISK